MSTTLSAADRDNQAKLKRALQEEKKASALENLAAALLGRLLDVPIAVAKSGFQHGGDGGSAGRQGRHLRLECKKYSDTTSLSDRELLGEIDHALSRDAALEAWLLVATRNVSEQLEQDLTQKGEAIGVPVIILDWKDHGLAALAALCAFDPDLVADILSPEAGALALALQPASGAGVEQIRRNIESWSLGFESLRCWSHEKLQRIWDSPRTSNAELGQNVAGGAQERKVRRRSVHQILDEWWRGAAKSDAPIAIIGWDGVGKTWAALDWLVDRMDDQPIVMVVPSSAAAELSGISEIAVRCFLADRLFEFDGARDRQHWRRRLDRLLVRPSEEGPVLTVFFDGLNQEPSTPWLQLLKVLQGDNFSGRVRVMVSTRNHHLSNRLSGLRGLIVPAELAPVDAYDTVPGGELDQMLAFEGLTQAELHPDLIELVRRPRLFKLVVRFRVRLVEAGQVTIHRLLWEYGRDTLGERAGRSFSEDEWHDWLKDIAQRHREGIREFSVKSLVETAHRPDLSAGEVFARLSDIIDGQFATPGPSGSLQLTPTVVVHALGAALLAQLDIVVPPNFAAIEAELTQWLDPIDGTDQRAEIVRAAVSILVERGGPTTAPLAGVLVTAWLQSQNLTDQHRLELVALAANLPGALLDAVEHSRAHAHASARLWAVRALRAISRSNALALAAVVARVRTWFSVVSRRVDARRDANADVERQRAQRFTTRVGVDASGPLTVLGVPLQLVDQDDGTLAAIAPSILEGFPLVPATPAFEAAAVALTIADRHEGWDGLQWLCLLNELDPDDAAAALRTLSTDVRGRTPEHGMSPDLAARAASLLLRLTGLEADAEHAFEIDPRLDRSLTYEDDYLPRPARSFFALERRHADAALLDSELRLEVRVRRTEEFWLDPTFSAPTAFIAEVRAAAVRMDVEKLDRHLDTTSEDHNFEALEPVLARCAPDLLADVVRRKVRSASTCPPASRYWNAIRTTEHFVLADATEADAARALRLSGRETDRSHETHAVNQLLVLELRGLSATEQIEVLLGADVEGIELELASVLEPPTADEADLLIGRFGGGSAKQQRDLIILLSLHPMAFGDTAWAWLERLAGGTGSDVRSLIFQMLFQADSVRFGRALLADNWSWTPTEHFGVNHYGTGALIDGASAIPFDQIAPRLAPWRLLEAARRRGGDPAEVCLAADIFGHVLTAENVQEPDPGCTLLVDRAARRSDPSAFSIQPTPNRDTTNHPFAALRAAMDVEGRLNAHRRAAETAVTRVRAAWRAGAHLYLAGVDAEDFEPVLRHARERVDVWLEEMSEPTADFERRVGLAEAPYLALCEALLHHDPERGATLWRALRLTIGTRFIGAAYIEELLHIVFRAPDSPAVEVLRDELFSVEHCHTDKALCELATAATYNGKADWLRSKIEADEASSRAWQRERGAILAGFTAHNDLPVAGAWPSGQIRTPHGGVRRESARLRSLEACAHYWWRTFLAAQDSVAAYAAWVLFLRSADRRAWIYMDADVRVSNDTDHFLQLKFSHTRLNRSKLRRMMGKREEKLDRHFLNRKIVGGIGPWSKKAG